MAIKVLYIPILGEYVRRLTFISGLQDTNANLCLFMRILYTLLPSDIRFDPAERDLAWYFLEIQYKAVYWLVRMFGFRVLPPPLRPLFVTYYGRAVRSASFVQEAILNDSVNQLVILGSGYDCSAYRTRQLRITKERYVKAFELDLADVQQRKIRMMKESMTEVEYQYYTEGVIFVPCDFDKQSVRTVLLQAGLDPTQSVAILWEGVTYYLDMKSIKSTLQEIQNIFSKGSLAHQSSIMSPSKPSSAQPSLVQPSSAAATDASVADASVADASVTDASVADSSTVERLVEPSSAMRPNEGSPVSADSTGCLSEDVPAMQEAGSPTIFLLFDYMPACSTLLKEGEHESWLWKLEQDLNQVAGTPFITGIQSVETLLSEYGFKVTRETSRLTHVGNLAKYDMLDVFFEPNSTQGHNEPNLIVVEAQYKVFV
ncbi:methyltransferase [Gregarina niphandrodes]|uniref:Methyltransferase n=1 Tax=Gregarina niphandrodes TaxID=110365 RepID=A0A023BD58_GRENI|nr:methyltransferase [Gregarina niphandrodes]EZG87063.1 methyltransferase [Gregarina niphandrodes]|eukprot:XP_011128705.1 methyltransferase [Gregarina niphandrodes]